MTLRPPRRIFRRQTGPSGSGVMRAAMGGVLSVGVTLGVIGLSSALFGHGTGSGGILSAPASEVAVVDGGTLRLGPHVLRLYGLTPLARGTACAGQGGQPQDCGRAAANALARMVGTDVSCRLRGEDGAGHALASCRSAGTDLGRALVAAGLARASGRDEALVDAESAARNAHRGIWAPAS
ncbi:MAG: thermonuclease family protein [Rhodospirillales bacterium]|nr:thermonuclease family protein [Rhodospirillales bacterium]